MREAISNLEHAIAAALQALDGLTGDEARERSEAIVRKAAELGFGGTSYHLHTLSYLTRDQIAACVRAEYNGRNVHVLARRYGKDRSTIYRILKKRGASSDDSRS